jgi:hypothetical protein
VKRREPERHRHRWKVGVNVNNKEKESVAEFTCFRIGSCGEGNESSASIQGR